MRSSMAFAPGGAGAYLSLKKRCARSDWSRIASYLAKINSREVITTGVLNSQMDASRFLNVTEEVIDAIEENSIPKSTKMLLSVT